MEKSDEHISMWRFSDRMYQTMWVEQRAFDMFCLFFFFFGAVSHVFTVIIIIISGRKIDHLTISPPSPPNSALKKFQSNERWCQKEILDFLSEPARNGLNHKIAIDGQKWLTTGSFIWLKSRSFEFVFQPWESLAYQLRAVTQCLSLGLWSRNNTHFGRLMWNLAMYRNTVWWE